MYYSSWVEYSVLVERAIYWSLVSTGVVLSNCFVVFLLSCLAAAGSYISHGIRKRIVGKEEM
jgi:hypothetical protein